MSFIQGIYALHYSINFSEPTFSDSGRLKVAIHPEESLEYLFSRIIAFAHARPLHAEFSSGLSNIKQPTLWSHSVIEEISAWIDVGSPLEKRVKTAKNICREAEVRFYFYEQEQVKKFCSLMRGSKDDWVSEMRFFMIDPSIVESLLEESSETLRDSNWEFTFADDSIFLEKDDQSLYGNLQELNMWSLFQDHIQNHVGA